MRTVSGGSVPSLIKWTGSKRAQAAAIHAVAPPHNCYYEPFVGGGAVLFHAAARGPAVAGDAYEPLIQLWRLVQSSPMLVADDYEAKWNRLAEELQEIGDRDASRDNDQQQADRKRPRAKRGEALPRFFYEVRDRFNQQPNPLDLNFLMRTCVNGIVRFNERGEFNNSFHLSRRGMAPATFRRNVNRWHAAIADVRFVCGDFVDTVAKAKQGDFVYLDPPYAGNHQRYIANLDLQRLFELLEDLNRREVAWALSFDGARDGEDLSHPVPRQLYRRRELLSNGDSAVGKVLQRARQPVLESLYCNFT